MNWTHCQQINLFGNWVWLVSKTLPMSNVPSRFSCKNVGQIIALEKWITFYLELSWKWNLKPIHIQQTDFTALPLHIICHSLFSEQSQLLTSGYICCVVLKGRICLNTCMNKRAQNNFLEKCYVDECQSMTQDIGWKTISMNIIYVSLCIEASRFKKLVSC